MKQTIVILPILISILLSQSVDVKDSDGNSLITIEDYGTTGFLDVTGNVRVGDYFVFTNEAMYLEMMGTLSPNTSYVWVGPDGFGDYVELHPLEAVSDGAWIGQILILEGDPYQGGMVMIPDNANTRLNVDRYLSPNDILMLIWNGFDWVEISYTDN